MNKRSSNSFGKVSARRTARPSPQSRQTKPGEGSTHSTEQTSSLEGELALYREALENARQDLQTFAYSVSHDLKAPLRAIEGFSKILLDDFAKDLGPEAQRFLKHVVANTEILGSQIEDLLRFYRAGKSVPTFIAVDADAICHEVISSLPPGQSDRIEIEGKLPAVQCDPVQLREIFTQLIGNAVKFTGNTASPRIQIRAKSEPGATRISIQDNGIGFDVRQATKLFQVFQKLHTCTEFPGNGIGLAIVKRLVQSHGGCVDVEAVPNQGATFCFTLPAKTRLEKVASNASVEKT